MVNVLGFLLKEAESVIMSVKIKNNKSDWSIMFSFWIF